MTSRSECIRGCMQPGIHFATCTDRVDAGGACTGCAPASPVDGLVVCGECRRRIRGLLRIAPDLLGRLRAMAGHGKAVVYSPVKVFTPASTVPEQVDAAVADALAKSTQANERRAAIMAHANGSADLKAQMCGDAFAAVPLADVLATLDKSAPTVAQALDTVGGAGVTANPTTPESPAAAEAKAKAESQEKSIASIKASGVSVL